MRSLLQSMWARHAEQQASSPSAAQSGGQHTSQNVRLCCHPAGARFLQAPRDSQQGPKCIARLRASLPTRGAIAASPTNHTKVRDPLVWRPRATWRFHLHWPWIHGWCHDWQGTQGRQESWLGRGPGVRRRPCHCWALWALPGLLSDRSQSRAEGGDPDVGIGPASPNHLG